jgi:periplasmic protein TonB
MHRFEATRKNRPAIAAIVLTVHLLMIWLWILVARAPVRALDPDSSTKPIYARIIEPPRPEPLGTPAPVKPTLVPVTHPKLPTPVVQLIEIDTLDSPAPGPDPAPSSSLLVTRPGPDNGGDKGYPVSMGGQELKVVRRVAPMYPRDSAMRGEAGLVQMRAQVDARGRVTEVQLVRSSGFDSLDKAAVRAVGKWRFEPQVQDGRAVSAWTLVNLRMSTYQQSYCRIRDEPTNGATGEDVHDGARTAATLGDEAAMRRLIDDLATGALKSPEPLLALLRDWGAVQSIHYSNDAGYQGWVTRDILPSYQGRHAGNSVQVRWDAYVVQHERVVTRWIVATDSAGEIWCVHIGRAAAGP